MYDNATTVHSSTAQFFRSFEYLAGLQAHLLQIQIHCYKANDAGPSGRTFYSAYGLGEQGHWNRGFESHSRYVPRPFKKSVDWRQCAAVIHREVVTVMPS
jgi:hypothetical protein